MTIKACTADLFEIVNDVPGLKGDAAPTITAELGLWEFEAAEQTGILIDIFGDRAPVIGPVEARRLAKWLMQAAASLDGGTKQQYRKGQKKRRHYEDEDDSAE